MKRCRYLLVPVLLGALAMPAAALNLFGKKPAKPDPKNRVPELLVIVSSDKDEHKRELAAEELRQFDVAAFPDIVPVLCSVVANDAKPGVRSEAVQSLSRIRPVSQEAGLAIEQALAKDTSMRVRIQARAALVQYHMAGYHSPKVGEGPTQSNEPPLTGPGTKGPAPAPAPKVQGQTPPPPLAPAPPPLPPEPPSAAPRPLPPGSSAEPPRFVPPPNLGNPGPDLNGPPL